MFTAKDLEVYKDALKEKKNRAAKEVEKPGPPSLAKLTKTSSKLNSEEPPLKERKPLSVVSKPMNTFKDPLKPPSPTPVFTSSSKHPVPVSVSKSTPAISKTPSAKLPNTAPNGSVKTPEPCTDSLRTPHDTPQVKVSHLKPDDKIAGTRKSKDSPNALNGVQQKSAASVVAKSGPAVDVTAASLCSECTRAASEGAVCFIGNDGRVSACTTRSAVRLCKNLNCAANNPDYVAAMANAPKKYLISKRHLLKAQYAPKNRGGQLKSLKLDRIEVAMSDGLSPAGNALSPYNSSTNFINDASSPSTTNISPLSDDGDSSQTSANAGFNVDEFYKLDGPSKGVLVVEDHTASNEDILSLHPCDEPAEFSFHERDSNATESPRLLTMEYSKEINNAQVEVHECFKGIINTEEGSQECCSLEELDDEDGHGSPMRQAINEVVEKMEVNSNMDGHVANVEEKTEGNGNMAPQMDFDGHITDVEESSDKGGHAANDDEIGDIGEHTADDNGKGENDVVIALVIEGQAEDNDKNGEIISPVVTKQVAEDDKSGDMASLVDECKEWDGAQSGDASSSDEAHHDQNDSQSGEDDDNNEEHDDDVVTNDTCLEENKSCGGMENTSVNGVNESQDDSATSNMKKSTTNKQRRRRILGVEDANPETVTLRKQQMQERKQAEEWMLNHAIEGVVQKLAPMGEAKVKILVEAFESIISQTDVEGVEHSHNASSHEKRVVA